MGAIGAYIKGELVKPLLLPQTLQFMALILTSLVGFVLVKLFIVKAAAGYHETILLLASFAFVVLTWHVKMAELPKAMAVLFKFMFILFGLYLLFPLTVPADLDVPYLTNIRLIYGHWLLAIFCFFGLWRPALGVIAIILNMCTRVTLTDILGAGLSHTEFFPIAEITVFMLVGAAAYPVLIKSRFFSSIDVPMTGNDKLTVLEKLALCGVAIHLANYLYSGVKKIFLGEHAFSWVVHNETWNLSLAANALGHLPLGINDFLLTSTMGGMQHFFIASNLLIFLGQIFAVLGALRIRWIILLTAFYDLTHIVIFLVSGIFFYKWIVFNFAIIAAMTAIRDKSIPYAMSVILVITMVCSPSVFFIAKLGWWDTRSFNHERFYAVTDTGEKIEVPTNYWGSFSVHYAQSRRIKDKSGGYFPTGTAAIIFGQDRMNLANNCKYTPDFTADVIKDVFSDPENPISKHVRLMHRYVLENVDEKGHIKYDLYPHHIWSMPWNFKEFAALDKRNIVSYEYVIDAVCLNYEDNEFTSSLMRHGSALIDVSDIKI